VVTTSLQTISAYARSVRSKLTMGQK